MTDQATAEAIIEAANVADEAIRDGLELLAAAVLYADCRDEETAARRVVTLKQSLLVARVEHVEKARKAAAQ
jgi:hypothetical protein